MSDSAPPVGELVFVKVLDAPRELVFRCMVEPEHLTHFWGPMGVSTPLPSIKVELRRGGVFETVMVNDADASRYRLQAVYDEVAEPERLVWTDTATGMTTTATFIDLGDSRTKVHIHQTKVPEPFRSAEAQAGFTTSLDRFATYLLGLAHSTPSPGGPVNRKGQPPQ
jgi:uncharacterized protein YndB with AHSA1/START domain